MALAEHFWFYFTFRDSVSRSPGCPGTHYVDEDDLEFPDSSLPPLLLEKEIKELLGSDSLHEGFIQILARGLLFKESS